jgi:hypothetical protein
MLKALLDFNAHAVLDRVLSSTKSTKQMTPDATRHGTFAFFYLHPKRH